MVFWSSNCGLAIWKLGKETEFPQVYFIVRIWCNSSYQSGWDCYVQKSRESGYSLNVNFVLLGVKFHARMFMAQV